MSPVLKSRCFAHSPDAGKVWALLEKLSRPSFVVLLCLAVPKGKQEKKATTTTESGKIWWVEGARKPPVLPLFNGSYFYLPYISLPPCLGWSLTLCECGPEAAGANRWRTACIRLTEIPTIASRKGGGKKLFIFMSWTVYTVICSTLRLKMWVLIRFYPPPPTPSTLLFLYHRVPQEEVSRLHGELSTLSGQEHSSISVHDADLSNGWPQGKGEFRSSLSSCVAGSFFLVNQCSFTIFFLYSFLFRLKWRHRWTQSTRQWLFSEFISGSASRETLPCSGRKQEMAGARSGMACNVIVETLYFVIQIFEVFKHTHTHTQSMTFSWQQDETSLECSMIAHCRNFLRTDICKLQNTCWL